MGRSGVAVFGDLYDLPRCRQHPKPIQQPVPLWSGSWVDSALAAAGVERFAVSLTAPDPAAMHEQLVDMAKMFLH